MTDHLVVWSGTLYRQQEAAYALVGEGWNQRGPHPLMRSAPKRDEYPSVKEIAQAKLIPADRYWPANYERPQVGRPKGSKSRLNPVTHCQTCDRLLTANWQRKGLLRCPQCRRANPGRRRAA